MTKARKTLVSVLQTPEAERLQALIIERGSAPILDRLGDRESALRFLRTNLRSSYLFARFAVPQYLAAVFDSLGRFPPTDDALGPMLSDLVETVRGELFNNNIFGREGECHAHYHDALEAYAAAGGDMAAVRAFNALETKVGFFEAARTSMERARGAGALWSPGSLKQAKRLMDCCRDPLAIFIMMPANEDLTPRLYGRALASLPDEPRYAKMRQFLGRHVALDEDAHGPVVLEWLDWHMKNARPDRAHVDRCIGKVMAVFGG